MKGCEGIIVDRFVPNVVFGVHQPALRILRLHLCFFPAGTPKLESRVGLGRREILKQP